MECYCDESPPSAFSCKIVKAKVTHICTECHNTIEIGTLYEKVWGIWDGDMSTFATCNQCFDTREFIRDIVPCVCWNYGNIWEDILENAREYSSEVPGMWVKVARVYIRLFPRRAKKSSLVVDY